VEHFDVAGISCNGCQHVTIERVVVGPQNNDIPTMGRYTHSRAFLPRLKHLNDKFGDQPITFYGREQTTVSALCQRMVDQMDMIYFNYIQNKQYDENDKEWIAAKKIYKNPTGWMDGGSSYGITINGRGAAVVGIGVRTDGVNNITMRNVEIFGIYNQAIEKIKFGLNADNGQPGTTRGILFDTIDWIATTDQIEDRSKSQYIGDVYTDVQFAAARFIDSWYYRNSYWIGQEDIDYVFKGNTEETGYPFLDIFPEREDFWQSEIIRSCGTDIQLHSTKGAIGMMINGAQDSNFDNIYIHDVYNWADLGMEVCGPYELIHITFEDMDIQYGYTGTKAHGLVIDYVTGDYTIKIENIESFHGEANGMTIYKESFVNLGNIVVNNINAGTQLNEDDVQQIVLPNTVPRACAVDIHDDTEISYVHGESVDDLVFDGIHGFEICDQFQRKYDNENVLSSIPVSFEFLMMFLFIIFAFAAFQFLFNKKRLKTINIGENTPLLLTTDKTVINNDNGRL